MRAFPILSTSRRILPFLLLVLLAAAPAVAEETALDPALEAFAAGDHARAIELASAVETDSPLRARAAYLIGEAHLALGQAAEAETFFREVLELKPDAVPARAALGKALAAQGKDEEAEKALREAVRQDKRDPYALRALGEFLLAAGNVKEGGAYLEQAFKRDPEDPMAARALVEALIATDASRRARKVADTLIHKRADHPMGYFLRAVTLDRDGKTDDAIAAYEEALARDDTFLDAHKNLAILCTTQNPVYSNKERTEKALAHYERYFELGGNDQELRRLYDSIRSFVGGR